MNRYLFSYFTDQTEADGEQVRFARSSGHDPVRWEPLRGGHPVLTWTGGRRGARDPFLLRAASLPGETANFYLLATDMRAHGHDTADFWEQDQRTGSRSIVVWESDDLVHWREPRLVEVAPVTAGNAWAPEATYDHSRHQYLVYWASKLYDESDPQHAANSYNRMLAATTTDFRTFSKAFVWSDPGQSVIDATVAREGDWWYRFVKDERTPDSSTPAAKFITSERSRDLLAQTWELVTEGIGRSLPGSAGLAHGEGPIAVGGSDGHPAYLMIDEFGLRNYQPFTAHDLGSETWRAVVEHELPPGARHGSILPVTEDEWERVGEL
jgi:hypothetical protein